MKTKHKYRKLYDLYAKCRFIDWLINKSKKHDFVLASELLYSDEKRYADIVQIWQNKTIAYEIKSEKDNFTKLPDQLNAYLKVFDYVYIVIHESHVKRIPTEINSKIGIIIESKTEKFIILKKAKKNTNTSNYSILASYSKNDIRDKFGLKINYSEYVDETRSKVAKVLLKTTVLQQFRHDLFIKYQHPMRYFMQDRYKNKTHPDDLLLLSADPSMKTKYFQDRP